MPLYDYACGACGEETEIRHKMSDPAPTECPSCGQQGLERLVSQSAFTLKGGGWYADGYSSKPEKGDKTDGGGEKKADAADKKSSDGEKKADKPAAKPEKSSPKTSDAA